MDEVMYQRYIRSYSKNEYAPIQSKWTCYRKASYLIESRIECTLNDSYVNALRN